MEGLIISTMLLPLIGGLGSFVFRHKRWTSWPGTIAVGTSMIAALVLLFKDNQQTWRFEWLPGFELGWQIDRICAAFSALVLLISFLVHLFSIVYMGHDKAKGRYFGFLGFFTFSMIGLLWADHLLLLFVFWELVGFSSYLLIGFWFETTENATSGRYAFVMNRVADTGLLSGILLLGLGQGTFFISSLPETQVSVLISILLIIGAFGKSAQGPFFTWLPRAMAGPTSVSALIHAATMVAAGVYLLVRIFPILADTALLVLGWVGAITALIAALTALTQYDIKKVLAYSTVSQLGYMVMGVGVGAPDAAFFHLWTHAFFKAGLFLSAGAVIHYMHHIGHHHTAQDMRAMGGLKKPLKWTFIAYTICSMALAGLPFFTGFLSKEGILLQSVHSAQTFGILGALMPVIGLFTAMLTAYYMMRQWLLVFFGEYRGDHLQYAYKEPLLSYLPLLVLAIGSIGLWYSLNPFAHHIALLKALFPQGYLTEHPVSWLGPTSIALAAIGLSIAYWLFKPATLKLDQSSRFEALQAVSLHAFFVDRLYQVTVVKGYEKLARITSWVDRRVIDRLINGLGVGTVLLSKAMDLVDKLVVDGVVRLVSTISYYTGNFVRLFHANRVQLHFFWALIALLIVILSSQLWW